MRNRWMGLSFNRQALCALLALLIFPTAAEAARKPNVLVIVADDLGFADVGFNGGTIPTPNLDRLASTGVNLTGFRAAPMCSPTRAGLMTGRWPLRFGMMRAVVPPWSKYGLPPEENPLAELLAPAGYEQRGLAGKWHLGHARREFLPLAQGFTSFYGHYNGAIDYFTHERDGETDWHRGDQTVKEPGYSTDLVGAEGARFIREAPADKPWLLYVPLNAPHSPMQAKEDDLAKFSGLGPKKKVYAAMVHAMDRAIGQILTAAEARPDAAETLVLFFSDNGGIPKAGGNNGPYRGAKLGVYEGGTRSCAAMRWPSGGVTGGKRFDGRVGYIDVLPTVLAAAGVETPKNLDGIDFLPPLRASKPLPERPWFSYIHQDAQAHASVHLGPWKLVAHGDFFSESPSAKATWELYDLAADPKEANDVAAQHSKKVAELRKLLREFGTWQNPGVGPYDEGREGFKPPKDWVVGG
ncbi:sulfatase-like hydrolase/transferase [Luteolibacter arcticus]|uniref:Sulfatase-like hydrolase/transferase n=1 Tax=Luteolibacter arcticus TaxID=1581411 RepID=A0ABT3GJK7_9BACT|nr:sulfatase-like hydrolase/transferase [Luteolibacter arcticus]MCW1923704.1 sulfatase-like hydrolase/transferase [Luteolibacter arcticus]